MGISMGFFYPKLKTFEFKTYIEIYVSWEWRMMQKLKRNWLLSSKLTWGLLTQALENLQKLHFNGLLLSKVYVWLVQGKVQRSYVWQHWILMQYLKENCLLLSKMTWEIWEICVRALERLKIWTLMGFF